MRGKINFIMLLSISSFRLGMYFVIIAWHALETTNSTAILGKVFLIGSLTTITLGPFVGVIIDKNNRRLVLMYGQVFITLSSLLPVILYQITNPQNSYSLYGAAFLFALGSLLSSGSGDGLFQKIVAVDKRVKTRVSLGVLQQISLMLGTLMAGLCISLWGANFSFLILFAISCISMLLSYFLFNNEIQNRPRSTSFWSEITVGMAYLIRSPPMLVLSIAMALTFSAAQITNLLLPTFVYQEIGGDSLLYGYAESAWATGGLISSLGVALVLRKYKMNYSEIAALFLLGTTACTFSVASESTPIFLAKLLLMGFFFSVTKLLCDGNLLKLCPENMMGRVRTATSSIISLFGVMIYLSPTFYMGDVSAISYYFGWGVITIIFSCIMFSIHKYCEYRKLFYIKDSF